MNAAKNARNRFENFKLIHFDRRKKTLQSFNTSELPSLLPADSLLVVNDAATFPARVRAYRSSTSELVELRFFPFLNDDKIFHAFVFSSYGWTTPTEKRSSPRHLKIGERFKIFDSVFHANVELEVSEVNGRLVGLGSNVSAPVLLQTLYKIGEVIQYSYHQKDLQLYDVQTLYGTKPWAAEMPSAGYFLTANILSDLRAAGVGIASLTHQTGLSSSGDANTDALLPYPEYFCIPAMTLDKIREAKRGGRKIIAVGTSVVRALESLAQSDLDNLHSDEACRRTTLKISKHHSMKLVDGIVSGLHAEGESHFELLEAFADENDLKRLTQQAEREQLLSHEYGDLCLIL